MTKVVETKIKLDFSNNPIPFVKIGTLQNYYPQN